MLHARLELHGEVHECLPCGDGCRKCSMEHGCERCDLFYYALDNGAGCSFAWGRLVLILAMVLGCLVGCAWLMADEDYEPRGRPPPRRRTDHADVLRRGSSLDEDSSDLRRRGGGGGSGRPDHSPPPLKQEASAGSYPLLQGYSGIEIVDSYGAK